MRRLLGVLASLVASLLVVACTATASAPAPTRAPGATTAPVPPPTAVPTPRPSTPTPPPLPTPTSTPAATTVRVANTDGEGVYLRRSPVMADRIRAYRDDTLLRIIGDDVDGEGGRWHHVAAPDGTQGYVPAQYVAEVPASPVAPIARAAPPQARAAPSLAPASSFEFGPANAPTSQPTRAALSAPIPARAAEASRPMATATSVAIPPASRPASTGSESLPPSAYSCDPPGLGCGEISQATGRVRDQYVRGYTRKDGTYVRPYYRSSPSGSTRRGRR